MPAKKPQPWYSVVVYSFIDEADAQEQIVTFERITASKQRSPNSSRLSIARSILMYSPPSLIL